MRHEATVLLGFSAFAAVLLVHARRRRVPALPNVAVSLPALYANIRKQCDEKANGWPHAASMLAKCTRDASGAPRPPAFSDGDGPIGAYAMLTTDDNLAVLRWCREGFDAFVDELVAGLPPGEQRTELSRMLWVVDERSYHICVSVFHEHPSLLPEEERRKWRRVDERLGERLAAALRASTGALAPPTLQLDSLSITADGAFIGTSADAPTRKCALGRCGAS
jgi:hypothetical protein